MTAYYNEIDPFVAAWLRELIKAGHIAPGEVDERSIEDVHPDDLKGFTQCHFFAGIGVWSYALRRAGWPDDRPVWTGSCPCQPFSAAGKGVGFDDERHLWPAWFWLISQSRPNTVFGEQVASGNGDAWIDLVGSDLEGCAYAFGLSEICATAFTPDRGRRRNFFVADTNVQRRNRKYALLRESKQIKSDLKITRRGQSAQNRVDGKWSAGADGKRRWLKSGLEPMAIGAPARVGRLRGFGNAINAEVATAFITAYLNS